MSDYLPWRDVSYWECTACGRCCFRFRVRLKPWECSRISWEWGPSYLEFDPSTGHHYLRKLPDGRCIFLGITPAGKALCLIHAANYRPYACRIWPFHITERSRCSRAQFDHQDRKYYVFVCKSCPNLRYGTPSQELEETIIEAIQLYLNPRIQPRKLTCNQIQELLPSSMILDRSSFRARSSQMLELAWLNLQP